MSQQPGRLYISSEDRVAGTHSDFTIQLAQGIQAPKSGAVELVSLPFLAPPIPNYENTLYINVYNTVGASLYPPLYTTIDTTQNYTLPGLVSALNSAMATLTDGTTTYDLSANIVWTLNGATNVPNSSKIQFACTGVAIQFVGYGGKGTTYWNNLSYRLGYPQKFNTYSPYNAGNYYTNTAGYVSAGNSWAYPSLLRTTNVYILSDLSQGDNVSTAGEYNILCKVPIEHLTAFGDTVIHTEHTHIKKLPPTITRFNIRLVDDEGKPFNIPDDGEGKVCIEITFEY